MTEFGVPCDGKMSVPVLISNSVKHQVMSVIAFLGSELRLFSSLVLFSNQPYVVEDILQRELYVYRGSIKH